MFAITGIALISLITDNPWVSEVRASSSLAATTADNPLMAQKLSFTAAHLDELAMLEKAGIAKEDIKRMQHLLLHKIEFSLHVSAPQQLMEQKLAATANEMKGLAGLEGQGLAHQDIDRIQQAILHKLGHLQDESFFVSLN